MHRYAVAVCLLAGCQTDKPQSLAWPEPRDLAGSVVYVGDSIIAQAPLFDSEINLGVSGSTPEQWCAHITRYSLADARAVVIEIGTNDIPSNQPEAAGVALRCIMDALPVPVVLSAIHPRYDSSVNGERVAGFNEVWRATCADYPNCTFVESPLDRPEYFRDGIHPTAEGYAIWLPILREQLP